MSEIEAFIESNTPWERLPESLQTIMGNSMREYEKRILDWSVKNQLRHKGNLVRTVKKNAEDYYQLIYHLLLNHLMLFPYHLQDVFVCGLRVTSFEFYSSMLQNIMKEEKELRFSLPNFTAADALRVLGIGRNQYIDLMNQSRSFRKLFRRRTVEELLPQQPVDIPLEPWQARSIFFSAHSWMIRHGCILEQDVKSLEPQEKEILDRLLEGFPILCGLLEKQCVCSLYRRGLLYFDVPISDEDYVYVPTLENFVMNRVNSDYLETLLYKIFVAIDGQMSVKELSDVIGVRIELVKNAISIFCRLGFAKKRNTGLENTIPPSRSAGNSLLDESVFLSDSFAELSSSLTNTTMGEEEDFPVRRALRFVGKLSDEAVGDFIQELAGVNFFGEGEVQRYSEHAKTLLHTLKAIRTLGEVDLIRGESLLNLDERARQRMIQKSYRLLLSMAPISSEACAFTQAIIPHIGCPIVEMASPWFRLFMYSLMGDGPTSIFFPIGTCLRRLPKQFTSKRLITSSGNHEPIVYTADSLLVQLGENLLSSSVFVQEYPEVVDGAEIRNIPFPFEDTEDELKDERHFANHPAVARLRTEFNLDVLCGYITLLRVREPPAVDENAEKADETTATSQEDRRSSAEGESEVDSVVSLPFPSSFTSTVTKDPRKVKTTKTRLEKGETFDDFVLFDCVFGVALFDEALNQEICRRIIANDLFSSDNLEKVLFASRNIVDSLKVFVGANRDPNYKNHFGQMDANFVPLPTSPVVFDSKTKSVYSLRSS
ncbi:Protein FAM91A1 [Aphelenchoides fujianensis]|nr:Protein FAM91A1 [Aphelenchoides fujianensis]